MPDLPSASTTLSGLKEWANPVFSSMLPYGYLEGGVMIGLALIVVIAGLGGLVYYAVTHRKHD